MIGEMRHRVTIERNDGVADGGGGMADNWVLVAAVWAKVEQFQSSPSAHAGRAAERVSMRATIRHRTDVNAGMRLTYEGEIYRIRAVSDPSQRKRFLALSCERDAGA
ncbi:phage head closure protein [bacterium AH-315-P15]|nr:phage head closure protein [bacterium AH-315-P15]